MGKIRIENKTIKEYLETEEEFSNVEEFCEWLLERHEDTNRKIALKEMLLECAENEEEKQKIKKGYFKDRVEWVRENCCIGEEIEKKPGIPGGGVGGGSGNVPEPPGVEKLDFKKIKAEFETEGYKELTPLDEEELDYTEGFVLHEGGIITQQNEVQLYVLKDGLELNLSKILIIEASGNKVLALGHLVKMSETGSDYTVVFDEKSFILYREFAG